MLKDANRLSKLAAASGGAPLRARLLVLQTSPDSPVEYIPFMNVIFSAQKAGISVNACVMTSGSVNAFDLSSFI